MPAYLFGMEVGQVTNDFLKVAGLIAVLLGALFLIRGGFRTKPSDEREDENTVIDRYLGSRGNDLDD